jgi:hypothetical protein
MDNEKLVLSSIWMRLKFPASARRPSGKRIAKDNKPRIVFGDAFILDTPNCDLQRNKPTPFRESPENFPKRARQCD